MEKKKRPANNITYFLRIMVGMYLIYIDYTFLMDWNKLSNKILFVIFMVVFAAVGTILIILSAKSLYRLWREQKLEVEDKPEEEEKLEEKDK